MNKAEVKNWPKEVGRYKIGNPQSCIAVCTLSSLDIELSDEYMNKIAVIGKCVIENIGIEKIIKNTITNPNIRYIILCGKEPKGHFVGQGMMALKKNGIDKNRRIIEARGALPYLRNLKDEEIDHFRKQVEFVDLIDYEEVNVIEKEIDKLIEKDPGPFTEIESFEEEKEVKIINADYDSDKQWTADAFPDQSFFVIELDRKNKNIIVEYYVGLGAKRILTSRIIGKKAETIAGTIVKRGLIKGVYHATYLGKELAKAQIALENNIDYQQESDLDLNKRAD